MKRRNFIKLSLATITAMVAPSLIMAQGVDLKNVDFSKTTYDDNNAQLLIVYLYGGASQLAGNITNIDEIKEKSQNNYDKYFRGITKTRNNCWQEAGGSHMEDMIDNGDITIFRTSYSKVREKTHNKAHGLCVAETQKGSFDIDSAGIVTNVAQILEKNGVLDKNKIMPFITFEGETNFYAQGDLPMSSYLRAVGLDEKLNNPYKRDTRKWYYYTSQERKSQEGYNNQKTGFDPEFTKTMDSIAQKTNTNQKMKDAFDKRPTLSDFIKSIAEDEIPDLGDDKYPTNDTFSEKIESAIKVLAHNEDTKIITVGTGGLGGWDDHNDAREYVKRSEKLFKTLKSAMAHLKAISKEQNISIMVFGEFGRNVNLNSANGWDHGNLQNFYILGGKKYFNHKGVVGKTELEATGAVNRLYLKPKTDTYSFEHLSIASTIYKIFGVTNPEILTSNNPPVEI